MLISFSLLSSYLEGEEMADSQKLITHIAGTFLIKANGSFLNGAGLGSGEDRNYSIIKTFQDGSRGHFYRVPYVSSQSWRRWLRNTLIEETDWKASKLRALHENKDGHTDKLGGEFNPVEYPEDDIFGYMRTEKGSGKPRKAVEAEDNGEDEEAVKQDATSTQRGTRVKTLARTSPLSTSILVSLRNSGWEGRDEGFVHLTEGTPQPYKTQFYNTNMQGIFCLSYKRLGTFSNVGDKVELD
jgi:CRISPR-associated protein Cst2